jgi:hypothetical protein
MRRFFSTIFDTMAQRLYGEEPARDPARLLRIRHAMLDLLPREDACGNDWPTERLRHRLLVAPDPHSLWFMRAELNQLLCQRMGERPAFALVAQLTPLFRGAVRPALLAPPGTAGTRARWHAPPPAR